MLKKTISLLLCLLMLVSAVPLAGLSASAAESEVPEGYTGIYNIEDLYCIRYALDGKYILMADIDMTEDTAPGGDWDNNGCGWAPIGENTSAPFTGVFDGNGHTVKGMRIDGIKTVAAGLFGCFSGEIKNLVFEDCAVSTTSTACTYCGVAAGYGLSGAKLTKVKVDGGTVSSSHSYTKNFNKNTIYVGGVAGCVDSSAAIRLCSNTAAVSGSLTIDNGSTDSATNITETVYVGGICGDAASGTTFDKCFNNGNCSAVCRSSGCFSSYYYLGYSYVYTAGICGRGGTITDCCNSGAISGKATAKSASNSSDKRSFAYNYSSGIGDTTVTRCINTGTVTGSATSDTTPGNCISAISNGTLSQNYYLNGSAASGKSGTTDTASTAVALSAAQMKLKAVFGYLDFDNTWFIDTDTGINHPQLIDNPEVEAESVSINTPATKTTFYHHEPIDITGLTLNVKYEGMEEPVVKTPGKNADICYDPEKLGEQTVTVTYFGRQCSYTVNVIPLPLEKVELNKTGITVDTGETYQLVAVFTPENATYNTVTWSSDDESVATVDENGLVSAKARGTAVITAETPEGKKAYCEVTVLVPATGIKIGETAITLNKGGQQTLTASLTPSNSTDTFSWSSTNDKIAAVDANGVVTAVAKGTTTITATTSRGVASSCTVTVKVPAEGVSLDLTEKELTVGQYVTLHATALPSDTTDSVKWSTDDSSVATVSTIGRVTAVSTGTAVITAETDSGKIAECVITVVIPATSVTLNKTSLTLDVGNTENLTATVLPANTTDTVKWSTTDDSVVQVSDGQISAVSAGKATVTVTTSRGKAASCTVYVREVMPQAYVNAESKTIENLVPGAAYLINGVSCTADSNGKIAVIEAWSGTQISIIKKNAVSVCNSTAQQLDIEHLHFYHLKNTVKATCTGEGYKEYVCSCGESYKTGEVQPLGHSFTKQVIDSVHLVSAATCTKKAVYRYGCSRCGVLSDETYEYGVPNGHSFTHYVSDGNVTCTADGTQTAKCDKCSVTNTKPLKKLGHNITSYAVTKKPTCTAKGEKQGKCTRCGYVKSVALSALGHKAVTDKAVAATCTKTGLTAGSHCSRCGKVLTAQKSVPALGHNSVTDKAVSPTCTKAGKTAGTHCSRCGTVLTAQKSVAALGHKVVTDKAVAPTCAKTGLTAGSHCSRCGKVIKAQQTVVKKDHTYTSKTVKATMDENGYTAKKCTVCGHISGKKTIYRVRTVKLSATGFTYDGKAKTPTVTVKDSNGTTLKKDSAYTVKYDTGRKEVGLYNVTVTLKGKYSGGEILMFKINPKGTAIGTLTAKPQGFDAKWSKQTTQTTGYQLQYSTSSSFSSAKTVAVSKNTTVSKSFTGLKASTKYYVRIRTYKSIDGIKYYSAWSSAKTVTTQKAVSIKLNASSATIYTGGTKALKATLYPTEQTVTWKSSDTSVATVSAGKVKAVGKGKATITASFKYEGKTYKATCTVTVKNPSISLSKTSATVNKGSSVTLKATTTPSDKTVTWKSSDTSVAKVSSSGKVTGVSKGKATITASFTYGGKTYKKTCAVTVNSVSAVKTRIDKVKSYIKKNGDIKYHRKYNDMDVYFTISLDDDGKLFFFVMNSYGDYDMCVAMSYDYGYSTVKMVGLFYEYDEIVSQFAAPISVAKYNEDYTYTASGNGYTADSVYDIFFSTVDLGFTGWNAILQDEFGFGMKDIGFKAYY